jgi:hypothetical protein
MRSISLPVLALAAAAPARGLEKVRAALTLSWSKVL